MRTQRSHSALCLRKSILEKVYRFHLGSSAAYLEVPVLNAWEENDGEVRMGKKIDEYSHVCDGSDCKHCNTFAILVLEQGKITR